jgi:hypothetical protein
VVVAQSLVSALQIPQHHGWLEKTVLRSLVEVLVALSMVVGLDSRDMPITTENNLLVLIFQFIYKLI